ncbi:sirohydrochlorin chelatase [Nitrospina watsonii]|uniref:CbiX domain-containing protein n=1 Tax=Nitrospina watsonii TaxID=1323948 RepID=A0ABM9HFG6_9BACT|nr:CbiX/SirB N-terminal domain-containing protein [Nitrospina watsonii]CAI2718972.1 CbiX domain-containing protein [Nitrospina watsonii]
MNDPKRAVVLVGHGGLPRDCPPDWVSRLKRLEGQRKATGQPPTPEELDLDRQIRHWPRTPENDPYHDGLQRLAERLDPLLQPAKLVIAYNEFCAPTVLEAVEKLVEAGYAEITVVPSMFTPGGSHSELEIPELLATLRGQFPELALHYAWPFDLDTLAAFLAGHLERFQPGKPPR